MVTLPKNFANLLIIRALMVPINLIPINISRPMSDTKVVEKDERVQKTTPVARVKDIVESEQSADRDASRRHHHKLDKKKIGTPQNKEGTTDSVIQETDALVTNYDERQAVIYSVKLVKSRQVEPHNPVIGKAVLTGSEPSDEDDEPGQHIDVEV